MPLPAGDVYSELLIPGQSVLSKPLVGRGVANVVAVEVMDTDDDDVVGGTIGVDDMPVVTLKCC